MADAPVFLTPFKATVTLHAARATTESVLLISLNARQEPNPHVGRESAVKYFVLCVHVCPLSRGPNFGRTFDTPEDEKLTRKLCMDSRWLLAAVLFNSGNAKRAKTRNASQFAVVARK